MNVLEYHAKTEVLVPAGIKVPEGAWCTDPLAAANAARSLGKCVVKAQVPAGKRGKTGGVVMADSPEEAWVAAEQILARTFAGHRPAAVLVEERLPLVSEFYCAVLFSPRERAPLVMFSTAGGMDVEEISAAQVQAIARHVVRDPDAFDAREALAMLHGIEFKARPMKDDVDHLQTQLADLLMRLYRGWRQTDAELIEINPLAVLGDHSLVALDCKFILDDAAAFRQPALAARAVADPLTESEQRAAALGLKLIALDGTVGVLANGAGLTMTTMDMVRHFGGKPANFLEIGGDAYVKAEPALALVLANPNVRSLVVNFCGAFARTDVMARGVVEAWRRLKPSVPVFFSVHGTGEEEAVSLIQDELGAVPFDVMEDAVRAAVEAAR